MQARQAVRRIQRHLQRAAALWQAPVSRQLDWPTLAGRSRQSWRRWQGRARRWRAYWAAGPSNKGSVVAVALSAVSALLLLTCCGFSALFIGPHTSAASAPNLAAAALAATSTSTIGTGPTLTPAPGSSPTPTPTPKLSSTEVINTPTPVATAATPIPTATTGVPIPGATATATRTATPGATPTKTATAGALPSTTATPTRTATPSAAPSATPTRTATAVPTATRPAVVPTNTAGASPTATATATPGVPTPSPLPTATRTLPGAGDAVLGGSQAAFIAKYGQPTSSSNPSVGRLQFQRYPNSNIDFLIVQLDIYDGPATSDRAYSITAQHPPNQPWSASQAQQICRGLMPTDARFQREVRLSTSGGVEGVDDVYRSSTLASIFPASAFVDAAQGRVTAGTFDIHYIYTTRGNSSQIDSCQLEVGLQQAPTTVTGNG